MTMTSTENLRFRKFKTPHLYSAVFRVTDTDNHYFKQPGSDFSNYSALKK